MQKFGRYEIIEQIGAGAMGMVYRAKDPAMGREVAIKTILSHAIDGPLSGEFRERFFREAQAAGRLAHPGIVTTYDVSEHEGTPFLVMEYVAGRTLQSMLQDGQRLDLEQSCEIGVQLADALSYAHDNGVIHRDIKPANILITRDGRAKIADFGVAKLAEAQATATGQLLGTPAFMAPEQFTGGRIDGRVDLFAVSVVIYWMATGDKPFTGDSILAVQYKVVHTDPIPPRRLNPAISTDLERLIIKGMAKNPAERYQSGEQLARDLRAIRDRRPILLQTATLASDDVQTLQFAADKTPTATAPTIEMPGRRRRDRYRSPIVQVMFFITLIVAIVMVGSLKILDKLKQNAAPTNTASGPATPTPSSSSKQNNAAPAAKRPAPPKPPDPPKSDAIALELTAKDRAGILFRTEGQPMQAFTMKPGDSITLNAEKEAALTLGNSKAVEAKLNGKPISFGEGRGGVFKITPQGVEEQQNSMGIPPVPMGNPGIARGNLGAGSRQRELAHSGVAARVLIKSAAVPETVTFMVRIDDATLFRREATARTPSTVPLAEERLIPPGEHKIQVSILGGPGRPGQSQEITGQFAAGEQRSLVIEFAPNQQRAFTITLQ